MTQETEPKKEETEFNAFQKLARALFRVNKRDVPVHKAKKRDEKKIDLPTAAKT